jgi:hypothetical protein
MPSKNDLNLPCASIINLLEPDGYFVWYVVRDLTFKNSAFYHILFSEVFCTDLRTNNDYFHTER